MANRPTARLRAKNKETGRWVTIGTFWPSKFGDGETFSPVLVAKEEYGELPALEIISKSEEYWFSRFPSKSGDDDWD